VQEQLQDPVVAADGWTYSREAIELWFQHGFETSPVTKDAFPSMTTVAHVLIRDVLQACLNPQQEQGVC
jgi:hypothetical protein